MKWQKAILLVNIEGVDAFALKYGHRQWMGGIRIAEYHFTLITNGEWKEAVVVG